jgi:hypothetical protein
VKDVGLCDGRERSGLSSAWRISYSHNTIGNAHDVERQLRLRRRGESEGRVTITGRDGPKLLECLGKQKVSLFGFRSKKEVFRKISEGLPFMCSPRPLLKSVQEGEEMERPSVKNPMCAGGLYRGNVVWTWTVSDVVSREKVEEGRGEKGLQIRDLKRMKTDTDGSQ